MSYYILYKAIWKRQRIIPKVKVMKLMERALHCTKEGETDNYIEEGEIEFMGGSFLEVLRKEEVRKWPLHHIK